MAFRPIQTSYWGDPYILELNPDEKLMYIYLLTNEYTKQCGIYEIPLSRVELETGYSGEQIYVLIHKFQNDGKIRYSVETHEIAVINWNKYNYNPSPKTMALVAKELAEVKEPLLVLWLYDPRQPLFDKVYQHTGKHIIIRNPWEKYFLENEHLLSECQITPIIPHARGMDTASYINININKNINIPETAGADVAAPPYTEIIDYLNQRTGSAYDPAIEHTKELIRGRWADGFRLDDFKKAIGYAVYKWADNEEFANCLRPKTIFGDGFESYVQAYERMNK